jgi:hypothetical protein
MNTILAWAEWPFTREFRAVLGRYTLIAAIVSFLVHLLGYAVKPWFPEFIQGPLFTHPINAIYTPFSVLLLFETYLLVYYLRRSTTIYVAKQYEIMVLILIRGVFKDLTHLELGQTGIWGPGMAELVWDLLCVLVVYASVLLFYRISGYVAEQDMPNQPEARNIRRFVRAKNLLAFGLFAVLAGLAVTSLAAWVQRGSALEHPVTDLNAVFFDQFYTVLIISDVFILLLSLMYSDDFPTIIRNSSFVISTILLKMSFSAESGVAQLLIVGGVSFGLVMLWITNGYYRKSGLGVPVNPRRSQSDPEPQ